MRLADLKRVPRRDATLLGRAAENVARTVDRKSLLKKALVAGVTVTYLDKLAAPAQADDSPIYYIDYGPTPLTQSLSIATMGCCSGSNACYDYGCGCEIGCCYQPAHSGNRCTRRYCSGSAYCWTCNGGTYVCCDYYCYGTNCHCGSQCSVNECGSAFC